MILKHGDCLELMKEVQDGSVDMILADLPYGTTACKWDTVIPFDPLWEQYKRVIKPNGAIVLTASQPFTSALVMSAPKLFRCEWIWNKVKSSSPLLARRHPLKIHENILVFSKEGHRYFPQGVVDIEPRKIKQAQSEVLNHKGEYLQTKSGYPKSIQTFKRDYGLHPTQKPVALFEYLIKTYTNEGETVLDNVMGSGTTGVACKNLNRNFIGFEKDPTYFEIAKKRIEEA